MGKDEFFKLAQLYGMSRTKFSRSLFVLSLLALGSGGLCMPAAAQGSDSLSPQTGTLAPFVFQFGAGGFPGSGIADDQGKLLVAPMHGLERFGADRWRQRDFANNVVRWLDDSGTVLGELEAVDIGYPLPDVDAGETLWPVFRHDQGEGVLEALVDRDGKLRQPWQRGRGTWYRTLHPQRLLWQPDDGDGIIFDLEGRERMRLDTAQWVAGPFPSRALYWLCPPQRREVCSLRDEQGGVVFQGHYDDLKELAGEDWLARAGAKAWLVLDAKGEIKGDRFYVARSYFPRVRDSGFAQLRAGAEKWPWWDVDAYALADLRADPGHPPMPALGILQHDGSFQVTGTKEGRQVCADRWFVWMADGRNWLQDGRGRLVLRLGRDEMFGHPEHPGVLERKRRVLMNRDEDWLTLTDCDGRTLFDDRKVLDAQAEPGGYLARSRGGILNVWISADLRKHVLPARSSIFSHDQQGLLLVVSVDDRHSRLYNTALRRFVGEGFDHAQAPAFNRVVFNRGGYYGVMDAEGRELLPPRFTQILDWGADRFWSRLPAENPQDGDRLVLRRADASIVREWIDASVMEGNRQWAWPQGKAVSVPAVAEVLRSLRASEGRYFVQQWVNRDGHTLLTAVRCPAAAEDVLVSGASVLMPGDGSTPLYWDGHCALPDGM